MSCLLVKEQVLEIVCFSKSHIARDYLAMFPTLILDRLSASPTVFKNRLPVAKSVQDGHSWIMLTMTKKC